MRTTLKIASMDRTPWRWLSAFLLLLLAFAIVGPTMAIPHEEPSHSVADAHHTHDEPCSEGDCDDNCLCLCCPGHASLILGAGESTLVWETAARLLVHPMTQHSPSGNLVRIDRPPQA